MSSGENTLNNGRIACVGMCVYFEHVCNGDHRSNEERIKRVSFAFNVCPSRRMWTNNELLIKSYDGRNERTIRLSTSSSSERLASACTCVCVYMYKKKFERELSSSL